MILRASGARLLASLVLFAALVGFAAAPAQAAGELGLSPDGTTWGSALPGPLFDPASRWVPGDSEVRSFYVRNQSGDDGILDVALVTGPVETLIATGDLKVSAKVGNGPYSSAETTGSHLLVNQVFVPSGAVRKVNVKIDFDPASSNQSQLLRLDFHFNVTLSQDASAVQPPTGNGGNGNGDGGNGNGASGGHGTGLPGTGTTLEPWMLLVGAGLVGSGLGLIGAARRRGHTEDPR